VIEEFSHLPTTTLALVLEFDHFSIESAAESPPKTLGTTMAFPTSKKARWHALALVGECYPNKFCSVLACLGTCASCTGQARSSKAPTLVPRIEC